ncbi:hypothetical protein MLD52_08930 [Puniceicoccaceae bacterium K14]|nr:hypothetical protein [Puniceicoccaceae bacterium K14]
MNSLLRANCCVLQQGIDLIKLHSDASYTKSDKSVFGSSLGSHIRHVLDHYRAFLNSIESGVVDYDNRKRDTIIEKSRQMAIDEAESLIKSFEILEFFEDKQVGVRVAASTEGSVKISQSSLARELQFLVSHTVHHYALIAIASRVQGIEPADTFGVAPSTLKYMQASNC